MRELLKQGYRGSRYSFGYPACPNLADQAAAAIAGAERIGVSISDEWQCTLNNHQRDRAAPPRAKYFSV